MDRTQQKLFYESPQSVIVPLTLEEGIFNESNTEPVGGKNDPDNEW